MQLLVHGLPVRRARPAAEIAQIRAQLAEHERYASIVLRRAISAVFSEGSRRIVQNMLSGPLFREAEAVSASGRAITFRAARPAWPSRLMCRRLSESCHAAMSMRLAVALFRPGLPRRHVAVRLNRPAMIEPIDPSQHGLRD